MSYIDFTLLIVVLTFVVLTIFLVRFLFVATITLTRFNASLSLLNKQLASLEETPKEFVQNIQNISADLFHKLECLNPLFHSLSNVGEGIESTTETFKRKIQLHSSKKKEGDDAPFNENIAEGGLASLVDFAVAGMRLWHSMKNKSS